MNKKAKAYVGLVITTGLTCFAFASYKYIQSLGGIVDLQYELFCFVIMLLLNIMCHSLPVNLDDVRQIDISTIITLSAALLKGPYFATIIAFLGFLFRTVRSDGKWTSLLNTPFYKTLFNCANLTIATLLSGLAVVLLTGMQWDAGIPDRYLALDIILPAIIFNLGSFVSNTVIMSILISLLSGRRVSSSLLWGTWGVLVTNVLVAMPMGYFIMRLMLIREDTLILILLFCIPLLLTRFTFKMNMDARHRYFQTISMLMNAIEARDVYTEGHSRRVEHYAQLLAQALGLSNSRIEGIKVAATLHDVGKIGILDSILRKPGPLDLEERHTIEGHPNIGLRILQDVTFNPHVIDAIQHHHEKYDGSGYPDGLKENQISIEAAILCVADVFDAMTTDRPYRKAIPKECVLEMMQEQSGKHFNPKVVDTFIHMIKNLPDEGEVR